MSQADQHRVRVESKHGAIGRVVKVKIGTGTLYKATRKHEYTLSKDGKGLELTLTDARGYRTRIIHDAMERKFQYNKSENGGAGDFRIVQQLNYNALGQCTDIKDINWITSTGTELRTKRMMEYDYWGQVCKTINHAGVATISSVDPILQAKTTGIDGKSLTRSTTKHPGRSPSSLFSSQMVLYTAIKILNLTAGAV
ncbi:hypothetical protein EYZ11_012721 [Aspergillus tanneri]|uniref:Uncharacterized protein n=1 Tax=Aspergillus tanneri TaxID=1220188 RepID=A0A4V3UML6_9EURO|nr:hypothetical protein EYZ11_012721 [Aspergillus tanneri]